MLDIDKTILATERQAGGKGHARQLRASKRLPAVLYGPKQASRFLALDPKIFVLQRRRFGAGALFDLSVTGGAAKATPAIKCLIKEVQVHPVTRAPLHVDLYAVDMERTLRVEVDIELEGKPAGAVDGGLLNQILRTVEVLCLPNQIPVSLKADVTPLKVGESVHLSDLKLPEGVKLTAHGDEAIAVVSEPDTAPVAPAADAAAATPAAGATATAAAGTAAKAGDKK